MIIKKRCPNCNKLLEPSYSLDLGNSEYFAFDCGHSLIEKKVNSITDTEIADFRALDGSKLMGFQREGVKFAFKSNCQLLFADEMRLGKTVQTFATLALRRDDLLPAIFICKSIAKIDILRQCINWLKVAPQTIDSSRAIAFEQFPVHIISHDMLGRIAENESWRKIVARAKTVIVDECHLIKNLTTARAKAVLKICRPRPESLLGEGAEYDKKIIMLSATPIENHAAEYFPVLNILRPLKFHNRQSYINSYVNIYSRYGQWKYGGLISPERFKEATAEFIIRRTIDEVMPELPKVWRQYKFSELGEKVQEIYDKEWQAFVEYWEAGSNGLSNFEFMSNVAAKIMRLRHLTGLAKVPDTAELIVEHLASNDRKLVVYVHHKDVGELLYNKIKELSEEEKEVASPLQLRSADVNDAQRIIDEFKSGASRVLIASTLTAGASVDLQFCSDVIMHERQWNFTKEDQAGSGRFRGILQKAERINLTYPIAIGTVDEYSAEVIDRKEKLYKEAMEGKAIKDEVWSENSIMTEIAEILAQKGKAKWQI